MKKPGKESKSELKSELKKPKSEPKKPKTELDKSKPEPKKPKSKKKLIIILSIASALIIAGITTAIILINLARIDFALVENPTYEVNTEHQVSSLFSSINSGTLEDEEKNLDTGTIGEKTETVTLTSQLGTKQTVDILYIVADTTAPEITGEDSLSFQAGETVDILAKYQSEDNSKTAPELSIDGEYDSNKAGEYKIYIVAKDESGNEARKEVTLTVTEPPRPAQTARSTSSAGSYYYIEVNRQQNVVIVYSKDQSGNYSNIAKVFVASTGAPGSETPLGTFTVTDRYEALHLVGDVWGHYTLRISGPYFFHSVPYFTRGYSNWDNLEYLEYNKLGNGASAGCVRLSAIDAKWIYDNIPYGTTVKIYDSATLPAGVTKPSAIKIDVNSPNRGWDPTDPNPANPWRG